MFSRPYETAKDMYGHDLFMEIINFCGKRGGIHSDHRCFVAGYPTHSSLIENESKKSVDKPDTWYIYIAVGDINVLLDLVPDGIEYVAYERFDGKIRLVELRRFYGNARHA